MSDTCRAPDGSKPFSFGMQPKTLAMMTLLVASTPLFLILVVPIVLTRIGRFFGWTLRRRTDGRRAQVLSAMAEEEEKFQQEKAEQKDVSSNEGWETIDASSLDLSSKEAEAQKDWDGIVGFFHPFW